VVSVLDDILDDPLVQANDEGFDADDEAAGAREIDSTAPHPSEADATPEENANLQPPEQAVPASRGEDRRHGPYQDVHPVGPGRLLPAIQGLPTGSSRGIFSFTFRIPPAITSTVTNAFGIYREYRGVITELPDKLRRIGFFTTRSTQLKPKPPYQPPDNPNVYGPCKNPSIFALQYWHWVLPGEGRTRDLRTCMADMTDMLWYNSSTIKQTNLANVDDELTSPLPPLNNDNKAPWEKTGWTHHEVKIAIPLPNMRDSYDPYAPSPSADSSQSNIFTVPGLYLRSLSSLIRDELTKPAARWFHWRPFSQFWKPDSAPTQRVYDELYSSPVWLEADRKVQELNIPGCTLPRAIAGLMFWSDSTCVSEFGTKSLWPIYLYFGNQSKYDRSRPSTNAGHQVAFLPTVSHVHLLLDAGFLFPTDSR
jgi:Plavaka transposase